MLLGAPGLTTRSKKLLVTKGIATSNKKQPMTNLTKSAMHLAFAGVLLDRMQNPRRKINLMLPSGLVRELWSLASADSWKVSTLSFEGAESHVIRMRMSSGLSANISKLISMVDK